MTTIIQAYRRTKACDHAFPDLGLVLEFRANERGHFVCAVESDEAVARLLQTPTGFRVYAEPPKLPAPALLKPAEAKEPADDSPYILAVPGGDPIDLRKWEEPQLRAFCAANGIRVHHLAKPDTIRDKIVEHLKAGD